ncbi:MAG TPA: recombinase family protein [Trebonia sp.]
MNAIISGTPQRAGILARISEDRDDNHLGTDRQVTDSRELGARLGWAFGPAATHVTAEDDTSAFKRYMTCPQCMRRSRQCTCPPMPRGQKRRTVLRTWRPAFRRLLEMIESGDCDGLVCYDLDRAARDPRDLEDLIDAVTAHGIPVVSVTGSLRLANDADIAMARVMVAMAYKSSADTARRVSRKRRENITTGRYGGGTRGYGFTLPAPGLGEVPAVVEHEAAEIRNWANQILAGVSMRQVAADTRARNVPTVSGAQWQQSTIRDILLAPRVAGLAKSGGSLYDAPHDAILEREVWEALRVYLTNPARKSMTGNVPKHLLSMIAKCGVCADAGVEQFVTVRGTKSVGLSYACRKNNGGHLRRKVGPVDEYVTGEVLRHLSAPDAARLYSRPDQPDKDALRREMDVLKARKAVIVRLTVDGTLTEAEVRAEAKPLNDRLREIEGELSRTVEITPLDLLPLGNMGRYAGTSPGSPVTKEDAVKAAREMREAWDQLPLGTRRAILRRTVDVTLLKAKSRYPDGSYWSPESVSITWK